MMAPLVSAKRAASATNGSGQASVTSVIASSGRCRSSWQRLRIVAQRAQPGDEVGAILRIPQPGEGHLGPRRVSPRALEKLVEVLVSPLAAEPGDRVG